MSTTKPATGWSREFPSVDGLYWWRRGESVLLGICQVDHGDVYIVGHVGPRYVVSDSQWLGPITPADFEQLAALRAVAPDALSSLEELYTAQQRLSHPDTRWGLPIYQKARTAIAALRNALSLRTDDAGLQGGDGEWE